MASLERIWLPLLDWWGRNARNLPWRFGRATPWGVLVSEVMSQQTQMSRVVPYWKTWMRTWPDAIALSSASRAEVITAWGRLGYPRRALRLQECAKVVGRQYHDKLPETYQELVELPGIGDYTASAVMSFAYGERIAVIDTNIRRVLSRVFLGVESLGGAATRAERDLAKEVLPEDGPRLESIKTLEDCGVADVAPAGIGPKATTEADLPACNQMNWFEKEPGGCLAQADEDTRSRAWHEPLSARWNQAVMELGALVCTAKKPLCLICPLADHCSFLKAGLPGLGRKRTRPRQHYAGTNRQVRGVILQALREAPGRPMPRTEVEGLNADRDQLDICLASLDDDGLIVINDDGSISLPI